MGRKRIRSGETVQFRPGERLGMLLDEFAAKFGVSRNEAARRLLQLAIRDLPLEVYPLVEQIEELMDGPADFGEACQELFACVKNAEKPGNRTELKRSSVETVSWAAQQLIELKRVSRGIKSEAETLEVHLYVSRKEGS